MPRTSNKAQLIVPRTDGKEDCINLRFNQCDLDIMVDSGLKGLSFFGLLEDVCSSVDCPVDLIDIQDIEPGSVIESEILRTGGNDIPVCLKDGVKYGRNDTRACCG